MSILSEKDNPRRLQVARERPLDRAYVPPAVECFAGEENRSTINSLKHRLRRARFRGRIRIGFARERIVCPVDGPRRDQFPHQLRWIEAEDFGKRGEPCFDQFTFAEVEPPLRLLLGSTSLPLISPGLWRATRDLGKVGRSFQRGTR